MNREHSIAWGVASLAIIALLLMLVYVNMVPSRGELGPDIHFQLLKTDKEWPSTVKVYGGMSRTGKDDTLWLLVVPEPVLLGGSFSVRTSAGNARFNIGDIFSSDWGRLYRVEIRGLRRFAKDPDDLTNSLSDHVQVEDFHGFLK